MLAKTTKPLWCGFVLYSTNNKVWTNLDNTNAIQSAWKDVLSKGAPSNSTLTQMLLTCEKQGLAQPAIDMWKMAPQLKLDSYSFAKLCFLCERASDSKTASELLNILENNQISGTVCAFYFCLTFRFIFPTSIG